MKAGQFELDRDAVAAMEAVTKQQLDAAGGGGGSPLTTKGDLFGFDTADARLPVGADGYVLTADAAEALGIKWAAPTGGGGTPTSGLGVLLKSAHTTLTNTVTTGTSAIQWGTEEAVIPTADLPDGDVTVIAFVEGQMDASSAGAPDRGRIILEASYDGGTNWSTITSIEPVLTIESTANDRGPWFNHHAHGTGTKTGDVMIRAMVRRNDTVDLSFERGQLTVLAYAEVSETLLSHVDTVGNGSDTSFTITHNLNTQDIVVSAWDLSGTDPESVGVGVALDNTDPNNAIVVTTDTAPATDELKIVVLAAGAAGGVPDDEIATVGTYTPAWTSDGTAPAIGNGTLAGRYALMGPQLMWITLTFIRGSTSTNGTGNYRFSLPPGYKSLAAGRTQTAAARILDAGTAHFSATAIVNPGLTYFSVIVADSAGARVFGGGVPVTLAVNDELNITGLIEVEEV